MDNLDIARISYISIVVLLNAIAASYFYCTPIRKILSSTAAINYFTLYFIFFGLGFLLFGFSLTSPSLITIVLNNICFLAAFYSLQAGFKYRRLACNDHFSLLKNPVMYANIAVVLSINIGVFYYLYDFYLMRAAILITNVVLLLTMTLKHVPMNPGRLSYGEKIALASVVISILCGLIVLIILKVTNHTFFYMSTLAAVQSIIAMLIMGGCMTIFLSDVSEMYYRESITDMLTGLFNRRHFFRQARVMMHSARRHKYPASLIICDVDHFKSVNDNHGHDVGDQVLIRFANEINSCVREEDLVARLGGEEFIIFMPQSNSQGAASLAERIRSATERLSFAGRQGRFNITASFGVVEVDSDQGDIESYVTSADAALYQAKGSGRNTVKVYQQGSEV